MFTSYRNAEYYDTAKEAPSVSSGALQAEYRKTPELFGGGVPLGITDGKPSPHRHRKEVNSMPELSGTIWWIFIILIIVLLPLFFFFFIPVLGQK